MSDERHRWSRSQRFELSSSGSDVVRNYMDEVVGARVKGGRHAFDEAGARWAARHSLALEDSLGMCELQHGKLTTAELVTRLDGCGPTPKSVRSMIERLLERGLVTLAVSATP